MTLEAISIDDNQNSHLIKKVNFLGEENPSLLLIHGWGSNHKIWEDCIVSFSDTFNIFILDLPGHGFCKNNHEQSMENYIQSLPIQILPDRFSIIGWSVGGIIASFLAKKFIDRVCNLIVICTNLHFLKHKDWPYAMEKSLFENFAEDLRVKDYGKILDRFHVLQTLGANSSKEDLHKVKSLSTKDQFSKKGLINTLNWLKNYDLSLIWKNLPMPVLHQYGQFDEIIPIESCNFLKQKYSNHFFQIYKKSSHMPFISEKRRWESETKKFLLSKCDNYFIDKKNISKSFSSVAKQYDKFSVVQKKIGIELLGLVSSYKKPKSETFNIFDFGSGTGFFTKDLKKLYPSSSIFELDLSLDMLNHSILNNSKGNSSVDTNGVYQIQGDIEELPIYHSSSDLIFSNLSIQWCENQERVFSGIAKALNQKGVAFIATLIDGTFKEIRNSWRNVDDNVHVNKFETADMIDLYCEKNNLEIFDSKIIQYKERFPSISGLHQSIKRIGAKNMNTGRHQGLLGKKKFNKYVKELDKYKIDKNTYQLTYMVKFLILRSN
jgi:malonyl-CoA O-methyltransferase